MCERQNPPHTHKRYTRIFRIQPVKRLCTGESVRLCFALPIYYTTNRFVCQDLFQIFFENSFVSSVTASVICVSKQNRCFVIYRSLMFILHKITAQKTSKFLSFVQGVENQTKKSCVMTKTNFKKGLYKSGDMWYNVYTDGNAATAIGT